MNPFDTVFGSQEKNPFDAVFASSGPNPFDAVFGPTTSQLAVTAPSGPQPDVRQPFPGERDYYKTHPDVASMAGEDNQISINPFREVSPADSASLIQNERVRIWLDKTGYEPKFELTPEQKSLFTDYGRSAAGAGTERDRRATVLARIISGDPSVGQITPEQEQEARRVQSLMTSMPPSGPLAASSTGGKPSVGGFLDFLRSTFFSGEEPIPPESEYPTPPAPPFGPLAAQSTGVVSQLAAEPFQPATIGPRQAPVDERQATIGLPTADATIGPPGPELGIIKTLFGGGEAAKDRLARSIVDPTRRRILDLVSGFTDVATGIVTDPFGATGYRPFSQEEKRAAYEGLYKGQEVSTEEKIAGGAGSLLGLAVPAGAMHKALGPAFNVLGERVVTKIMSRVPAKILQPFLESGALGTIYSWLSAGTTMTPTQALEETANWVMIGGALGNIAPGVRALKGKEVFPVKARAGEPAPTEAAGGIAKEGAAPGPADVPATVVHGTTTDALRSIESSGYLSPQKGPNLTGAYGEDPSLRGQVFASSPLAPHAAITAMADGIARKLGKQISDVTIEDVRQHGAMIIAERSRFAHRGRWTEDFEIPGVEPGDFFSDNMVPVQSVLKGDALVGWVSQKSPKFFKTELTPPAVPPAANIPAPALPPEPSQPRAGSAIPKEGTLSRRPQEQAARPETPTGEVQGWSETDGGRSLYKATRKEVESENAKEQHVRNLLLKSPSFPKLIAAVKRKRASLGTSMRGNPDDLSRQRPWDLLNESAGVMDAKSQRAKTLVALEDAVYRETGLPRKPKGKFRGEDSIDWDRVAPRKAIESVGGGSENKGRLAGTKREPPGAEKAATPEVTTTGPPKPPPVEPIKPVETPSPQGSVGLSQAEITKYRQGMGFDVLDAATRQRKQKTMELARQEGADHAALDNADAILRAHAEGRSVPALSNTEQVGMDMRRLDFETEYTEAMDAGRKARAAGDAKGAEAALERASRARDNVEKLTGALFRARTASGRGLQIGNVTLPSESLPAALAEYEVRNGRPAPPEVKARLEKLHEQLTVVRESERKALEANDRLAAERDKAIAEQVTKSEVTKARIRKQAGAQRSRTAEVRADAYAKLEAMGIKVASGINPEGLYQVGRIAISHIRDGATSLNEVVRLVKEKIPDITDQDIYEALGTKDPKLQARAAGEAPKRIAAIKREASLLAQINDAINGIFKEPKQTRAQLPEIRALQTQLRHLRNGAYETISNGANLEKAVQRINELQDMLDNHYRAIKAQKPVLPEDLKAFRAKAADLQKRMKLEDERIDLEEQFRTRDFRVPPQRTTEYVSPELERSQIEVNRLRKLRKLILEEGAQKTTAQKIGAGVQEGVNIMRELKATGDVSFTLRQNVVAALSHPILTAEKFGPSIKGMFNQHTAEAIQNGMEHSTNRYMYDKMGLKLNELEHVPGPHEEMFSSRLLDKIPVVRTVTRASNRHMTLLGNLVRTGLADNFIRRYPNATTAELQAYGRFLNVSTGIGEVGILGPAGKGLNLLVFAPKLAVSRFQTPYLAVKAMLGKDGPHVRKQVARDVVGFVATGLSILEVAKLAGAKVGDDPREADFGKIRIGNTFVDVFGGFLQPTRLVLRLMEGGMDRAGWTGKDLLPSEKNVDPLDLVMRYVSYKSSPVVSTGYSLWTGKTIIGQPITPTQVMIDAVTPLLISGIKEAWKEEGPGRAALVGGLSAFGVGTSTYPPSKTATRKQITEALNRGEDTKAIDLREKWNAKNPHQRIVEIGDTRQKWVDHIKRLRSQGEDTEAEKARNSWNRRHPQQWIE